MPKKILRDYQKTGVEFAIQSLETHAGVLIADETGLGKTVQALTVIEKLANTDDIFLVICPTFLKQKWFDEIRKFLPRHRKYTIIVKSYNELSNPDLLRYTVRHEYKLVVIDEMHYLKNFNSIRTQAIFGAPGMRHKTIRNCTEKMLGLSATPIPNRIGEIYPWLWASNNGIIKNKTYEQFVTFWAQSYKFTKFGLTHKGIKNAKLLKDKLSNTLIRRKKHDVLSELPPGFRDYIYLPCSVDLYKEEKQLFEELLKTAGYEGGRFEMLMNNPDFIEQLLKTVPGFDQLTKFKLWQGLFKIKHVMNYLKKNVLPETKKFILFCYHADVAKTYYKKLKVKNKTLVTGAVNPDERFKMLKQANDDPEHILVATMGSVKEGFDLIGFDRAYFAEIDWTYYVLEQAEGRLLRYGQKNAVEWVYFIFERGLEKYMYNLVDNKKTTVNKILA